MLRHRSQSNLLAPGPSILVRLASHMCHLRLTLSLSRSVCVSPAIYKPLWSTGITRADARTHTHTKKGFSSQRTLQIPVKQNKYKVYPGMTVCGLRRRTIHYIGKAATLCVSYEIRLWMLRIEAAGQLYY